jgi:hypothetical protein
MQRIFSFLLLLFLPMAALADGMVIPTIAYPAKITIPDQRALICYTNGTERLVIETRFTGSGTNFAWVVPLPSQPVIEEATTGLFPTLQYLFRPEIVHEVPPYYLRILATIGLIYLFRLLIKYASTDFIIFIIFLLSLAVLLLPALSSAKRKSMASTSSEQNVSILDRKLVGIFETTTIASHDAKALQAWLSENGFAMPTNAEPVIASYVKDGWVFVATKIRRDKPDNETSTPHPLSFTFKTDKPVYPMRLTGVDNGPLSVEFYVFGSSRAKAAHFKVERCVRPNYPVIAIKPTYDMAYEMNYWRRWLPETPDIVHPLLRKCVDGSPVATKLTATLSPAQMRQDVWINWIPFWEKKNHLFSQSGAEIIALNWGSVFFTVGLIIGFFLFAAETHKPKLPRYVVIVLATSLGLTGLIYLSLPKIEVRLVRGYPGSESEKTLSSLSVWLEDTNPVVLADVRSEAKRLLSNPTNDIQWVRYASPSMKAGNNDLLGGHIHEEDSPGNYTLCETSDGRLKFVTYDAEGAEHVFGDWPLASPH